LEFIIKNQDQRSTHTSEDVGKSTLEEGFTTFLCVDLSDTIESTSVHNISSTRLHHKSSSNGIKGIRDQTRDTSDNLGNHELEKNAGFTVREQNSLQSVVTTEIASSVDDDTKDRDTEALIKTLHTIRFVDLGETVSETLELSISSAFTDIGSKSSSGEIQRIDDHKRSSTSSTTRGQISHEELPEISLGVEGTENLLIGVLESKVKSLSGEISDDVSEVTSPESRKAFFLGNSHHTINDTLVFLITRDLGVGILGLEKELNSFNWSDSSLGDGSRDTSKHEIQSEVSGFDR